MLKAIIGLSALCVLFVNPHTVSGHVPRTSPEGACGASPGFPYGLPSLSVEETFAPNPLRFYMETESVIPADPASPGYPSALFIGFQGSLLPDGMGITLDGAFRNGSNQCAFSVVPSVCLLFLMPYNGVREGYLLVGPPTPSALDFGFFCQWVGLPTISANPSQPIMITSNAVVVGIAQ